MVVDGSVDVGVVWMWFEMWVWRGSDGGGVDVALDVVLDECVWMMMMEMEMESHGGLKVTIRQTE